MLDCVAFPSGVCVCVCIPPRVYLCVTVCVSVSASVHACMYVCCNLVHPVSLLLLATGSWKVSEQCNEMIARNTHTHTHSLSLSLSVGQ